MARWVVTSAAATACAAFVVVTAQTSPPDWREFRRTHPYHTQVIALSRPDNAGLRTLIVAEPPPHVTLNSLAAVDPALGQPIVMKHRVGMDGWVKDVVYRISARSDGEL